MSKSRNRVEVPEAKEAMNKFKMEVANELGVPIISEETFLEMVNGS